MGRAERIGAISSQPKDGGRLQRGTTAPTASDRFNNRDSLLREMLNGDRFPRLGLFSFYFSAFLVAHRYRAPQRYNPTQADSTHIILQHRRTQAQALSNRRLAHISYSFDT